MSPTSHLNADLHGDYPRPRQCDAHFIRRERNPEGNGLTAKTVRCTLRSAGSHPYHAAPDPFDGSAYVWWVDGGGAILKPRGVSIVEPGGILLAPDGTRVLPDTPAADDTLGAPSGDVAEPETEPEEPTEALVQELGALADTLARHVTHLRTENHRLRRLLDDADAELTRYRTGQVAA